MRRFWRIFLAFSLITSACAEVQPVYFIGQADDIIPPLPDLCGTSVHAHLAGKHFTTLADQRFVDHLRILWPMQEVTSELRPRRLNAEVDDQGTIQTFYCG